MGNPLLNKKITFKDSQSHYLSGHKNAKGRTSNSSKRDSGQVSSFIWNKKLLLLGHAKGRVIIGNKICS